MPYSKKFSLQALLFTLASLISAALLFSIQPIVSKMLLPILGGSPAVWNTTVVFFQSVLVAGYLYAFAVAKFLPVRAQMVVHIAVLAAAGYFLPVAIAGVSMEIDFARPQAWLLLTLLTTVAVPAVAISASTTILQTWFSYSSHEDAGDPYFLYAASNLGSLAALLSYPIVLEPMLGLDAQSSGWASVYVLFIVLVIGCAFLIRGRPGKTVPIDAERLTTQATQARWSERLHWMALAFVPSMMLLGVTLQVSIDVASAPFLWVVPLIIYLLTFIIAFTRRELLSRNLILESHAFILIMLMVYFSATDSWLVLGLHLAALFVSALVCHDLLARKRPDSSRLAEFYLCIAIGGWLGGIAGGVVAPQIFNTVLEYPIAIVLACLFRTPLVRRDGSAVTGYVFAAAAIVIGLATSFGFDPTSLLPPAWAPLLFYGALAVALYGCRKFVLPFTLAIGLITLDSQMISSDSNLLARERTFFGIYEVSVSANGRVRKLMHGSTVHGAQAVQRELQKLPLTYYNREGPIGQLIAGYRADRGIEEIGVVGLGTGTLACYRQGDEQMIFFEIDPMVVRFAISPSLFTYIELCGQNAKVRIGDGRLLLEATPDGQFDVLVLDAFSSDAIPVHLLTREAIAMYFDKLGPRGVLAFHTSNRYVDLPPVLARLAREQGYTGLIQNYEPDEDAERRSAYPSQWIVLARAGDSLEFLRRRGKWQLLESVGVGDLWTDDYSNLFRSVLWPKLMWSREAPEYPATAQPGAMTGDALPEAPPPSANGEQADQHQPE